MSLPRVLRVCGWLCFLAGAALLVLWDQFLPGIIVMGSGAILTSSSMLFSTLRAMRRRRERIKELRDERERS